MKKKVRFVAPFLTGIDEVPIEDSSQAGTGLLSFPVNPF
jgi:hypothetical protein